MPPSAAGREWRAVLVVADSRWDKKAAPLHLPQYDWYQYGGLLRPVVLSEEGALRLRAVGRAAAATRCLTGSTRAWAPPRLAFTRGVAA